MSCDKKYFSMLNQIVLKPQGTLQKNQNSLQVHESMQKST